MLVRNKWNKRLYKVVKETDFTVTLEREDKSQFTITKKEFHVYYTKENA